MEFKSRMFKIYEGQTEFTEKGRDVGVYDDVGFSVHAVSSANHFKCLF